MVKLSVDLNEPKDSSKTDKAAQNGRIPKSLTLEIYHGRWFTPTPSRSYIGGQVSSVNVVNIDEFCLHDLKDMVVKLGYSVEDLMYCYFFIPSLGLDYVLYSLNVDVDVLEMSKYVKDYKLILVYVEHGSSIFVTPKKGVSIAINNHLRKCPIEFDSGPDPSSSVESLIVVECAKDPFEELGDLVREYAHIGKQITGNEITGNEITRNESTGNEITGKQMVVHVGNSSTVDDVLELGMLFETEEVGPVGKFKEVEVDANNESEEVSDTEGDYTMDSDSEDLDYDPKHDDVFDDDEHIVEEVHVNMNNFIFTADPKHDTSIGGVDVQDDDLDVIDYDSFGSDLDDGIDSEKRMQLRELRRIGKQKIKVPINHVIKSLATNPDIPVRTVQDKMQKQFEVGVSKMKAFRAKRIASDIMTGSYREQYSLLKEYAQELINQNPGTTVWVDVQQEPNPESLTRTFRRVYVCLRALKQAVGVDTNNGIYPVAYAIVEAESKASWCWFLNLLGEDLGIEANFNYTFISAITSVFPSAEHRYCVRHIHENMKSQFKGGVYKEMLWNAAKATFKGRAKCDLLINNICEVFTRKLVDGRDQPIITCLEYIREYLMKRIVVVQKVIAKTVGPLTPSVTKMFDAIKKKATEYNVQWNGGYSGQGGSSSQAGARKVSGQSASATNVSGQAAGARKVSGQAVGATNVSGQAAGARKVSGQAADARKASSQPSAA
ncbi:mutator type transposase [Tanacetum coccineum]